MNAMFIMNDNFPKCEAGHPVHCIKLVPSIQGDFLIYDYEKYMDFNGYCMGQDDVSRTIDLYGTWSMDMHSFITRTLLLKKHGLFIDVGSHIGWFSRLAIRLGYTVVGFEGATENIKLAEVNAPGATFNNVWFDKNTKPSSILYGGDLMKMDIEGNEQYGLVYFEKSFELGHIRDVVIEISPVFNNSYPALIKRMKDWGYAVFNIDGTEWNGKFDFEQTDLWFKYAR